MICLCIIWALSCIDGLAQNCSSSTAIADILNKAPGKPYIHKLSLLASQFVMSTYIINYLF